MGNFQVDSLAKLGYIFLSGQIRLILLQHSVLSFPRKGMATQA